MQGNEMTIKDDCGSIVIEDFDATDIMRIMHIIISLRDESTIRDLVFNKSLAAFLVSCEKYLKNATIPEGYKKLSYDIEKDSMLHQKMENSFHEAMMANFGENYSDYGTEFVKEMRSIFFAPFTVTG